MAFQGFHPTFVVILLGSLAHAALAAVVIVPTDQATVQGAVNAAGAGGTVIINSNATFTETVTVTQSVTIQAGPGFTPTIRGSATCDFPATCTLFFKPNSAAAQTLVVQGLHFLPSTTATQGNPGEVVAVLNLGAGDANFTLKDFAIADPGSLGPKAITIRSLTCPSGKNHATLMNGSISLGGVADQSSDGITMGEGGSLMASDIYLTKTDGGGSALDIFSASTCGGITFGLADSTIIVNAPNDSFSADLGRIADAVSATVERTTFRAISNAKGSVDGFRLNGGPISARLDANRFFGSGPNVDEAVLADPFAGEAVALTATNNVVQHMGGGFRFVPQPGSPGGSVSATVANNTVDGSIYDAISLFAFPGASLIVRLASNLLTNSGGWGIAIGGAGMLAVSADYNGYFNNASGNVQPPLAPGVNNVVGDPHYVNRPAGDLRLVVVSPMIDQGSNLDVYTAADADGAPRIQNVIVDIGAFEGGISGSTVAAAPALGTAALALLSAALLAAGWRLRARAAHQR